MPRTADLGMCGYPKSCKVDRVIEFLHSIVPDDPRDASGVLIDSTIDSTIDATIDSTINCTSGAGPSFSGILKKQMIFLEKKVVIFCRWTNSIRGLRQRLDVENCLTQEKIDALSEDDPLRDILQKRLFTHVTYSGAEDKMSREASLMRFKRDANVLIANIGTAGQGLNLQHASVVVMMNPEWNPCVELQAIARLHRQGQTQPVFIFRPYVPGTIEEHCQSVLEKKLVQIQSILVGSDEQERIGMAKRISSADDQNDAISFWKTRLDKRLEILRLFFQLRDLKAKLQDPSLRSVLAP